MGVIAIDYKKSDGVAKEIGVWEESREQLMKVVDSCVDIESFLREFLEHPHGMELQNRAKFPPHSKILDIGFGKGESSIFLASLGHRVHAIEPSPLLCEFLASLAKKFALPIQVYESTGEAICFIEEGAFDVCIFSSSLHHCDDPLAALRHCYAKLNKGGKVLLFNEPILKFYRSKRWHQKMLEFYPEKLGHYGGNEHIYYYREYLQLLSNSGFLHLKDYFHSSLQHPRSVIQMDLTRKLNNVYCLSNLKIAIKFLILVILKRMIENKVLSQTILGMMKRLSLMPMSFEGIK